MLKCVAFVVLHYGAVEVTERCVRSIFQLNNSQKIRVVVVDNDIQKSSEDRRLLEQRLAEHSQLKILKNEGTGGFSEANNIGYSYAKEVLKAECIILLNNDIEFPQVDFIRRLEQSIEHMRCHVIGPNVIQKQTGEPQNPLDTRLRTEKEAAYTIRMNRIAFRILPIVFPLLQAQEQLLKWNNIRKKKAKQDYYKTIQKHIVPFGACLIFTPSFVRKEKKAFLPETNFYYEEYLLALRCFRQGYETGYDPSLRVWHEGGAATRQSYGKRFRKMSFVMKNTADACEIYLQERLRNTGKKKMLYFMPVEWSWIAQRPHFLAQELGKEYDVTVVCPRFLVKNWKEQNTTEKPKQLIQVPQIPLQERFEILRAAGTQIFRHYIGDIHNYDIVWFGTPMFFRILPKDYRGKVVYDFMDDIAALQSSKRVKLHVEKNHQRLLIRADRIFVTSRFLLETLDEEARRKACLMRNAYREGHVLPITETLEIRPSAGKPFCLGYIGTIAAWMDFDILEKSLTRFSNIEYHLWGPIGREIPKHERIIYHGVAEHDKLAELVQKMDCLIMPFKVNPVVLAVDPVKLYEYISFGKPILCVQYPEIKRFEPYVWFYHDEEDYMTVLENLISRKKRCKYSEEMRRQFLQENSWEYRGKQIMKILKETT